MHNHKYFIFETRSSFEIVPTQLFDINGDPQDYDCYRRVEYAVSGCACGDVRKQLIQLMQQAKEHEDE